MSRISHRKWTALLALVGAGLVASLVGCGPSPRSLSSPVQRGHEAPAEVIAEAQALWEGRLDRAKLDGAIAAWKRAVAVADDDAASWLMLSRATYFLGDSFMDLERTPKPVQARVFEDAAAYADRGLRALSARYERRRTGGAEVEVAAADLGPEAAPYLYYWALGTIRWAEKVGWTAGMKVYKPVGRVMEQVERLNPAFDHGGADRYLGAFYATAPSAAGGDPGKGRAYFERAIAQDPMYLDNYLVMAHRYAVTVHDGRLFEANVRFVALTPSAVIPDSIAEQEVTKVKAQRLAAAHPDLLGTR